MYTIGKNEYNNRTKDFLDDTKGYKRKSMDEQDNYFTKNDLIYINDEQKKNENKIKKNLYVNVDLGLTRTNAIGIDSVNNKIKLENKNKYKQYDDSDNDVSTEYETSLNEHQRKRLILLDRNNPSYPKPQKIIVGKKEISKEEKKDNNIYINDTKEEYNKMEINHSNSKLNDYMNNENYKNENKIQKIDIRITPRKLYNEIKYNELKNMKINNIKDTEEMKKSNSFNTNSYINNSFVNNQLKEMENNIPSLHYNNLKQNEIKKSNTYNKENENVHENENENKNEYIKDMKKNNIVNKIIDENNDKITIKIMKRRNSENEIQSNKNKINNIYQNTYIEKKNTSTFNNIVYVNDREEKNKNIISKSNNSINYSFDDVEKKKQSNIITKKDIKTLTRVNINKNNEEINNIYINCENIHNKKINNIKEKSYDNKNNEMNSENTKNNIIKDEYNIYSRKSWIQGNIIKDENEKKLSNNYEQFSKNNNIQMKSNNIYENNIDNWKQMNYINNTDNCESKLKILNENKLNDQKIDPYPSSSSSLSSSSSDDDDLNFHEYDDIKHVKIDVKTNKNEIQKKKEVNINKYNEPNKILNEPKCNKNYNVNQKQENKPLSNSTAISLNENKVINVAKKKIGNSKIKNDKMVYIEYEDLEDFTDDINADVIEEIVLDLVENSKEQEWNKQIEQLINLRRLMKFHTKLFFEKQEKALRKIVRSIIELLNSPRSCVSKNALLCLSEFYNSGKKKTDNTIDDVILPCLKKAHQTSVDFISTAANNTLLSICNACSESKLINYFIKQITSKQRTYNLLCLRCLIAVLIKFDENFIKYKEAHKIVDAIIECTASGTAEIKCTARVALVVLENIHPIKKLCGKYVSDAKMKKIETMINKTTENEIDLVLGKIVIN